MNNWQYKILILIFLLNLNVKIDNTTDCSLLQIL
jgi:hypothetical protein